MCFLCFLSSAVVAELEEVSELEEAAVLSLLDGVDEESAAVELVSEDELEVDGAALVSAAAPDVSAPAPELLEAAPLLAAGVSADVAGELDEDWASAGMAAIRVAAAAPAKRILRVIWRSPARARPMSSLSEVDGDHRSFVALEGRQKRDFVRGLQTVAFKTPELVEA